MVVVVVVAIVVVAVAVGRSLVVVVGYGHDCVSWALHAAAATVALAIVAAPGVVLGVAAVVHCCLHRRIPTRMDSSGQFQDTEAVCAHSPEGADPDAAMVMCWSALDPVVDGMAYRRIPAGRELSGQFQDTEGGYTLSRRGRRGGAVGVNRALTLACRRARRRRLCVGFLQR